MRNPTQQRRFTYHLKKLEVKVTAVLRSTCKHFLIIYADEEMADSIKMQCGCSILCIVDSSIAFLCFMFNIDLPADNEL